MPCINRLGHHLTSHDKKKVHQMKIKVTIVSISEIILGILLEGSSKRILKEGLEKGDTIPSSKYILGVELGGIC